MSISEPNQPLYKAPECRCCTIFGIPVVPPVWKYAQYGSLSFSVKFNFLFCLDVSKLNSIILALCSMFNFGRNKGTSKFNGKLTCGKRSISTTVSTHCAF